MKVYLIVSSPSISVSEKNFNKIKEVVDVEQIIHVGKISEIKEIVQDDSEKILAVDPDCFEWNLDIDDLKKIKNVKAVVTQPTSFDWLKPGDLKNLGIMANNVPFFSTDSVAEYALCMTIEAARSLPLLIKNNWKIDWNAKTFLLKGKKVGIIGLGHIGKRYAELAQGIGLDVYYWSRSQRDDRFKFIELERLFSECDVIFPALTENYETKSLITKELLDSLKSTAIFIAMNRIKEVFDQEYVIKLVEEGKIGGYAFEGDNAKDMHEYKGNILALPPIAWYTQDSLVNLENIWTDTIISIVKQNPINVVN